MARSKTRRADGYSTYERSDGRWGWAVTIGVDGLTGNPKRRQGTCRTKREAVEKAQAVLEMYKQGALPAEGRTPRLGDFLDEWLKDVVVPNLAPKTTKYYRDMCRLHIVPELGNLPLRKITQQTVQRLLNEKAAEGLSPSTVRGFCAVLKTAFNYAIDLKQVTINPTVRVKLPKLEPKEIQYLTQDQVRVLLSTSMGHPLHSLFVLALATGMRIGELTGLTWDDVDLESRTIRVRQQLQRVEGSLVLRGLKSRSSRRVLHVADIALQALREQKERLSDLGIERELVFVTEVGTPLDQRNINRALYGLLELAGLPRVSFHALRHSAATLSVSNGVPLAVVRDQLGHSSIALTAGAYSHAVPEAMRRAADHLSGLLGAD